MHQLQRTRVHLAQQYSSFAERVNLPEELLQTHATLVIDVRLGNKGGLETGIFDADTHVDILAYHILIAAHLLIAAT